MLCNFQLKRYFKSKIYIKKNSFHFLKNKINLYLSKLNFKL